MVRDLNKYLNSYTGVKAYVEENFVTKATISMARKLCFQKRILHMGIGNGLAAKMLDEIVDRQTVIEGSGAILDKFAFKSKKTEFIEVLFEEFQSGDKYNVILANHVMEHVDDPVNVLEHIKSFLEDDGKIFITVPNANSIHRLIGVKMGLLENKFELNKSDIELGHQRVYDFNSLKDDIKKAGLTIKDSGGYNLKMVSLSQMKDWPQELLDAIFVVSQSMPKEICANLWVTCKYNG